MNILSEIKMNFIRAEGLYRLMLVNIFIFLIIGLAKVVFYLTGTNTAFILLAIDKFAAQSSVSQMLHQPWSLLTYMFIHENFMHILFNMLVLYWTGRIFCEYLGSRSLVSVYILGGIAGALLFMVTYNIFPSFATSVDHASLIGASAGVIAILVGIAAFLPNYTVYLLLFGGVRLKYIAAFLVILSVINIPDGNAGGQFSHIGGAVFGLVYGRSVRNGNDMVAWMNRLSASLMSWFRSPAIRMVHQKKNGTKPGKVYKPKQQVIDEILDKISRSGYSSLSSEEKEVLFRESKNSGNDK